MSATTERVPAGRAVTRSRPYQGYLPFTADDSKWFFGRDEWIEIVIDHLSAHRISVLYGESGVGKSSLLHAKVVPRLSAEAEHFTATGVAEVAVASFAKWSAQDPLSALKETIRRAAAKLSPELATDLPQDSLASMAVDLCERLGGSLVIVLDQFEELFAYHTGEVLRAFEADLTEVHWRRDARVNVLIAIREDALAKLDRLQRTIPRLLDNLLRIEHLDRKAARKAIKRPIGEWNRVHPEDDPYTIEPGLVNAVIDAAAARADDVASDPTTEHVEAPFLQLVMERVWDATVAAGAHALTLARLDQLGGAKKIVDTHVKNALSELNYRERAVAADVFRFLVTRSRTKFAQSAAELAERTNRPVSRVAHVLKKLSGKDVRILRPVAPVAGDRTGTRYELFHDLLAEPISDWRRDFDRSRTIRRAAAAVVGSLVVVAVVAALGAWALVKRNEANRATRAANLRAVTATADDQLHTPLGKSLLLSLAAYREDPSFDSRNSLALSLQAVAAQPIRVIFRVRGSVARVAVSPDSKTVAAVDNSGKVRLLDARAGKPLGPTLRRANGVPISVSREPGLAFSPDGRVLAAGGEAAITLWDVAAHKRLEPPLRDRDMRGSVRTVVFSRDGKLLASAGYDELVRLWDVEARKLVGHPLEGHTQPIQSIALSPDGTTLASGGDDKTIRLWDIRAGRQLGRPLNSHTGSVLALAFGRDGTLASAGRDGTIELWDVKRQIASSRPLGEAGSSILSIAFSPDGRILASSADDGTIRLWDVAKRKPFATSMKPAIGAVRSLAFDGEGNLVSGSADGAVIVWRATLEGTAGQPLPTRSPAPVLTVAVSPDARLLASGGDDRKIRLWALRAHKSLAAALAAGGSVTALAFSPDSTILASGAADTIRLWRSRTASPLAAPLRIPRRDVQSLALSRTGLLAAGDTDGTVRLWDVRQATKPRLLGQPLAGSDRRNDKRFVYSVAFSPDGKTLASGGWDGTLRLWDVTTAAHPTPLGMPLKGPAGSIRTVAFDPEGELIATGSGDGTTWFWNAKTREKVGDPLPGVGAVESVVFTPSGEILASAGDDGMLRFWDVATHRQVGQPLRAHNGPIRSIALTRDAAVLASAGDDGTVRLWSGMLWSSLADLRSRVCSLVVGGLTRPEWAAIAPDLHYEPDCPT